MIFVDSNIPMYLVGKAHPHKLDAQRLLETCVPVALRRRGCRGAHLRVTTSPTTLAPGSARTSSSPSCEVSTHPPVSSTS